MYIIPQLSVSRISCLNSCNSAEDFFFLAMPYMKDSPSILFLSGEETDCSRYCVAGWDPLIIISSKARNARLWIKGKDVAKSFRHYDALLYIDEVINHLSRDISDHAEPFIGGFMGYVAYEYKNMIEPCLPQMAKDDLGLPDMFWMFPSRLMIFDKRENRLQAYSWHLSDKKKLSFASGLKNRELDSFEFGPIRSNFSRDTYIKAVKKIKDYIRHGDVYQVNLSQRFYAEFRGDPLSLFYRLFISKPAPFYAYINAGDYHIVSTSMERFLWSNGRIIETRPIKGTRPRGRTEEEDLQYEQDLLTNQKDDAEISMIVDLLRNDLGKICLPGSVRVKEHKRIETYAYVHHLVSIIEGELVDYEDMFTRIINATFPGGSITGCPKIRAMEIIDEIEPNVRHVYTGSIGYFGLHRKMDLNIAIRTMIIKGKISYYGAGGGIVYDSDPEAEYEETLNKAEVFFGAKGKSR